MACETGLQHLKHFCRTSRLLMTVIFGDEREPFLTFLNNRAVPTEFLQNLGLLMLQLNHVLHMNRKPTGVMGLVKNKNKCPSLTERTKRQWGISRSNTRDQYANCRDSFLMEASHSSFWQTLSGAYMPSIVSFFSMLPASKNTW